MEDDSRLGWIRIFPRKFGKCYDRMEMVLETDRQL